MKKESDIFTSQPPQLLMTRLGRALTIPLVKQSLSDGRTLAHSPNLDNWSCKPSDTAMSEHTSQPISDGGLQLSERSRPVTMTPNFSYRVGGSLSYSDSSYVVRRADTDLMEAACQGQFAYVFGPRQIGKSSLRIRARHQLAERGYQCATVQANQLLDRPQTDQDVSQRCTTRLLATLWDGLQPTNELSIHKTRLAYLSTPQPASPRSASTQPASTQPASPQLTSERLHQFVQKILAPLLTQGPIVIFIDEIDALLHTPFAAELFDWISSCYQYRTSHADPTIREWYQSLNFVVLGSAIASELPCRDTLFSAHSRIALEPFKPEELFPLQQGFDGKIETTSDLIQAVFHWTQGQPFLTQKICYILQILIKQLVQSSDKPLVLSSNTIQQWVNDAVRSHIIRDWPHQDEPIHLRAISDRITRSPNKPALKALYRKIYAGTPISLDDSHTQAELLLSGIVVPKQNQLQIANDIYRHVFPLK